MYSSIINQRLMRFLESNRITVEEQNGFRGERSCGQHLFAVQEIVQSRLNEAKLTHVWFIDFCKAFDYVDRNLLLSKLVELRITTKMYTAIEQSYDTTLKCN